MPISMRQLLGITICAGALLLGRAAAADDLKDQRHLVELGVFGGAFFPAGTHDLMDMDKAKYDDLERINLDLGVRIGYLPFPFIGLEIEGGVIPASVKAGGNALLFDVRAHVLAQYPARVAPFLVAGGGILGVSSEDSVLGKDIDPMVYWGLGVKAYVTRWLAVRLDARHVISDGGSRVEQGTGNHSFEVLAGISAVLGWKKAPEPPKDSDGDGVTDDKDKCPKTAAKTTDGCPPPDTDGDGVTDDRDRCPKKAGKGSDGCPKDTDGDGVTDDVDSCPTEAAKTPTGCPPADTDGDGVADDKDKCPKEPAKTADGCPPKDTDGDGIVDDKDKCVDKPETKNGYQDEDGCPDTVPKAVKRFSGAIRGISFAVNKALIRKRSYGTLNAAIKVLKEYPDLRLIIRGHSDKSGKRKRNVELSKARAQAVKDYLTGKGIDGARLKVEGVGPDEPIASNKTRRGRAKNRRIEFKLGQ